MYYSFVEYFSIPFFGGIQLLSLCCVMLFRAFLFVVPAYVILVFAAYTLKWTVSFCLAASTSLLSLECDCRFRVRSRRSKRDLVTCRTRIPLGRLLPQQLRQVSRNFCTPQPLMYSLVINIVQSSVIMCASYSLKTLLVKEFHRMLWSLWLFINMNFVTHG